MHPCPSRAARLADALCGYDSLTRLLSICLFFFSSCGWVRDMYRCQRAQHACVLVSSFIMEEGGR